MLLLATNIYTYHGLFAPVLQVYVSIYAEGPMRVLCFAEEKTSITSVDDVNSVVNMAIR